MWHLHYSTVSLERGLCRFLSTGNLLSSAAHAEQRGVERPVAVGMNLAAFRNLLLPHFFLYGAIKRMHWDTSLSKEW